MNVKELKQIINNLPDDTVILLDDCEFDNIECKSTRIVTSYPFSTKNGLVSKVVIIMSGDES